jgi:hypothetical protein
MVTLFSSVELLVSYQNPPLNNLLLGSPPHTTLQIGDPKPSHTTPGHFTTLPTLFPGSSLRTFVTSARQQFGVVERPSVFLLSLGVSPMPILTALLSADPTNSSDNYVALSKLRSSFERFLPLNRALETSLSVLAFMKDVPAHLEFDSAVAPDVAFPLTAHLVLPPLNANTPALPLRITSARLDRGVWLCTAVGLLVRYTRSSLLLLSSLDPDAPPGTVSIERRPCVCSDTDLMEIDQYATTDEFDFRADAVLRTNLHNNVLARLLICNPSRLVFHA